MKGAPVMAPPLRTNQGDRLGGSICFTRPAPGLPGGLEPASPANVVRPGGDDVLTTDGPLAEANEQVGGFWVIETESLESAMEWARDAAAACEGPVEFARSQWVGDYPISRTCFGLGPPPLGEDETRTTFGHGAHRDAPCLRRA
jgi:hypothetical protein